MTNYEASQVTDSAKNYKIRAPGMLHESVRQSKKRVKKGGEWVWSKPTYVKLCTHTLPDGAKLRTKAGSQIIDRTWFYIRAELKGNAGKPGSETLARAVRSAQWLYWSRGTDLWK